MKKPPATPLALTLSLLAVVLASTGCGSSAGAAARDSAPLAMVSPSPDGYANDEQPTLRWNPLEGATRYRVTLFADPHHTATIESEEVDGIELRTAAVLTDRSLVYPRVEALDAAGGTLAYHDSRFAVVVVPDGFPRFEIVVRDAARIQPGYTLDACRTPCRPSPRTASRRW